MRIVAVGAVSVGLGLVVLLGNEIVHGGNQQIWSSLVLYASYAFLIVCIAVAVLRYRLYDVELILSRGLVVAVAAGFAAAGSSAWWSPSADGRPPDRWLLGLAGRDVSGGSRLPAPA